MHGLVRIAALACVALPILAQAEPPKLDLPRFRHLERQAVESVDINIGRLPLRIASWFMDETDPEDAEVKRTLKGLHSVRVRHYRFASDFIYSKRDVDAVRSQLSRKGWSPLAQVRDRNAQEEVDVYLALDQEKITGMAVVVSEPREFTIVNIVGSLDPEQINKLREQFTPGGDPVASDAEPSANL
jgi:hypothetical protein